jgi:hypothetical protein
VAGLPKPPNAVAGAAGAVLTALTAAALAPGADVPGGAPNRFLPNRPPVGAVLGGGPAGVVDPAAGASAGLPKEKGAGVPAGVVEPRGEGVTGFAGVWKPPKAGGAGAEVTGGVAAGAPKPLKGVGAWAAVPPREKDPIEVGAADAPLAGAGREEGAPNDGVAAGALLAAGGPNEKPPAGFAMVDPNGLDVAVDAGAGCPKEKPVLAGGAAGAGWPKEKPVAGGCDVAAENPYEITSSPTSARAHAGRNRKRQVRASRLQLPSDERKMLSRARAHRCPPSKPEARQRRTLRHVLACEKTPTKPLTHCSRSSGCLK